MESLASDDFHLENLLVDSHQGVADVVEQHEQQLLCFIQVKVMQVHFLEAVFLRVEEGYGHRLSLQKPDGF